MSKENFFVNRFLFFQEKNQNDYFYNALVYIFEHNKNGALGVVMNKIIPISEEKIFKSLDIKTSNDKKHILKYYLFHPRGNPHQYLACPASLDE